MPDQKSLIETNPAIMFGKPVVAGTRIPVDLVLRKLAAGMTAEEIAAEYPTLTAQVIRDVAGEAQ